MHCEPPPITFIPCEEHFRPVLPTIEGNVDYLALRGQLTTMDELLRTSGVENEFVMRSLEHWIKTLSESKVEQIELSGEGQSGVIRLEDLVSGKQQVRFQEHSVRALRCSIARTLLVGSFRDFAARLADSPLLQWFCQVAQLDRVKVPAKSTGPGMRFARRDAPGLQSRMRQHWDRQTLGRWWNWYTCRSSRTLLRY